MKLWFGTSVGWEKASDLVRTSHETGTALGPFYVSSNTMSFNFPTGITRQNVGLWLSNRLLHVFNIFNILQAYEMTPNGGVDFILSITESPLEGVVEDSQVVRGTIVVAGCGATYRQRWLTARHRGIGSTLPHIIC